MVDGSVGDIGSCAVVRLGRVGRSGRSRPGGVTGKLYVCSAPDRRLRARLASGDVVRTVGLVSTLREVGEYQDVAEWIRDDGHSADRDVERLCEDPPARLGDLGRGRIGRLHEPVRLVTVFGGENDFRVAAGHGQSGLPDGIISPLEHVAQACCVEGKAGVEVWDFDCDSVDFAEESFVHDDQCPRFRFSRRGRVASSNAGKERTVRPPPLVEHGLRSLDHCRTRAGQDLRGHQHEKEEVVVTHFPERHHLPGLTSPSWTGRERLDMRLIDNVRSRAQVRLP